MMTMMMMMKKKKKKMMMICVALYPTIKSWLKAFKQNNNKKNHTDIIKRKGGMKAKSSL